MRVRPFLDSLVSQGVMSSAVALVGTREEVELEEAAGEARAGVPAEISTRFDHASVTKPFMATLALVLDA
jgi:CubicO group peptidase (beta-lactamase class C family)